MVIAAQQSFVEILGTFASRYRVVMRSIFSLDGTIQNVEPQSVVADMGKSTQSSRLAVDLFVVCPMFSISRRRLLQTRSGPKIP
jgi:hypothetical protein